MENLSAEYKEAQVMKVVAKCNVSEAVATLYLEINDWFVIDACGAIWTDIANNCLKLNA